jgi:hypothetical protein
VVHQAAHLQSIVTVFDLGVLTGDGVDPETVATGQQSSKARTKGVAEEVLNAAAESDPERGESRDAKEHSPSDRNALGGLLRAHEIDARGAEHSAGEVTWMTPIELMGLSCFVGNNAFIPPATTPLSPLAQRGG